VLKRNEFDFHGGVFSVVDAINYYDTTIKKIRGV
jgi:hypothetical protein